MSKTESIAAVIRRYPELARSMLIPEHLQQAERVWANWLDSLRQEKAK